MQTVTTIVEEIHGINATLAACSSLAPSPTVNEALSRLVTVVLSTPAPVAVEVYTELAARGVVRVLQQQAQEAETELEFWWSCTLRGLDTLTWDALTTFPYFNCYQDLTALEMRSIERRDGPVLFVGGGSLPLSALMMAQVYNRTVTIIDVNREAVVAAQSLVDRLGLSHLVTVIQADIKTYVPTQSIIVLAAMVGSTQIEKQIIAEHLFSVSPNGTTVLARSVVGLAQLLYVPLPTPTLWQEECVLSSETVINTTHVWKNVCL